MKELTEEEFIDRASALLRARKIFIDSGVTKNISLAFELYQAVCAERERAIFISSQVQGNRPRTPMDKYNRPKCPDCHSDMFFRPLSQNVEGIAVQLVCSNVNCDVVLNSENDIAWWADNLRIKDGAA